MAKRLHVIGDLCNGCRLCEMICSFVNAREFNPCKAKIRVAKVESEGFDMPVLDCDGTVCPGMTPSGTPKCVEMCPTGALFFVDLEEAVKMTREWAAKKAIQPIFKVIAPWKYPYPWRKWPFSKGE